MKKWILFMIILVGGGAALVWGALKFLPYYFYGEVIEGKMRMEIYKTKEVEEKILTGEFFNFDGKETIIIDETKLWKRFHFSEFVIPLPVHHPLFTITPYIRHINKGKEPQMGINFLTPSKDPLLTFKIEESELFDTTPENQNLFKYPYIRKFLSKKSRNEIWQDMFSINLKKYAEVPKVELAYYLYLLSLRKKYFPENYKKFSFYKKRRLGIIEIADENLDYRSEWVWMLIDGKAYSFNLRFKIDSAESVGIRKIFYKNIQHRASYPDSARPIYSEYQRLTYKQKIDQEGMVYLLAAWSHNSLDMDFLRMAIEFLERGRNQLLQLDPFYQYGIKQFGSNFTKIDKKRIESKRLSLERKIRKEESDELGRMREDSSFIREIEPETDKERAEYYLRKAKETNEKNEEEKDILILN